MRPDGEHVVSVLSSSLDLIHRMLLNALDRRVEDTIDAYFIEFFQLLVHGDLEQRVVLVYVDQFLQAAFLTVISVVEEVYLCDLGFALIEVALVFFLECVLFLLVRFDLSYMVKHGLNDDFHASGMHVLDKGFELIFSAKFIVDFEEVSRPVTVVTIDS